MKRFLSLLILLVLFPLSSLADLPDLSGLSFDELVRLKEQLNLAIWTSKEWQAVTVPSGIWEVGKDIPEGHWTIGPANGCGPDYVIYASALTDDGHDVDILAGPYIMEAVCHPNSMLYSLECKEVTDIVMQKGHFVRLDCAMVFTPYTGKPDLGFK